MPLSAHALTVPVPTGFRLATVATSHGWFDLPPYQWSPRVGRLEITCEILGRIGEMAIEQRKASAIQCTVELSGRWTPALERRCERLVRDMLNLDVDLNGFFAATGNEYAWARKIGAGRLLRSPTIFEDAVKVLATTNCSWALTKKMVGRIVETLGEPGPSGKKCFPAPQAMANAPERFYRDAIKAGYRSAYFRAFAVNVANGEVDPQSWADPKLDTQSVMKLIRRSPGFGRYAAENLCRLLGRHEGLGLDSWCLNKFPKVHGPVDENVETAIRRHYQKYGSHQGLALWLDLTKDWHEENRFALEPTEFTKDWS